MSKTSEESGDSKIISSVWKQCFGLGVDAYTGD